MQPLHATEGDARMHSTQHNHWAYIRADRHAPVKEAPNELLQRCLRVAGDLL